MKEHKSNQELLEYIQSKGVKVKNRKKALEHFEKYTYYSIINTYKDVFKKNGNYIKGVTYDEIFALYKFDKELKIIFLKYALEIETIIKSLLSNTILKKYGIEEYLKYNCFDSNVDKSLIDNLKTQINQEISKNYKKHSAITHYKDKYGFIPPYVIVKVITLGEVSRYYGILKQEDRQKISRYFKLSDKLLKQILKNLTLARNDSAHNDRLYTFHSKFFISYKNIDRFYKIEDDSTNLYMLINCMGKLLNDKDFNKFVKQVNSEINKLSEKLKSISINDILNIMGFPKE